MGVGSDLWFNLVEVSFGAFGFGEKLLADNVRVPSRIVSSLQKPMPAAKAGIDYM